MNVDDVFLVLHHHWALDTSTFPDERQRLQLAFLVLLCAYTGTRPGGLNNKQLWKYLNMINQLILLPRRHSEQIVPILTVVST